MILAKTERICLDHLGRFAMMEVRHMEARFLLGFVAILAFLLWDLTIGFLNLANVPIIRLVGGGQFRKGVWLYPDMC